MNSDERIEAFYSSARWRTCRLAFLRERGGLCEVCLSRGLIEPATQVHHRNHITPENVDNPDVTLDHGNLMALCEECHREQHRGKRWRSDAMGHISL